MNGPSGYGRVILWFKDDKNWISPFMYPLANGVWILEAINGMVTDTCYPYKSSNYGWNEPKGKLMP